MYRLLIIFFIFISSICTGQTLYFNPGVSYSSLDLEVSLGSQQKQFKDPIIGSAFLAGIEYFEQKYFSVSSDIAYFQSGGKLSAEELQFLPDNYEPKEITNKYFSIGSTINFNPLNNKFILQFQFGPRIDFLTNSVDSVPYRYFNSRNGLARINYGLSAGVGAYYKINRIRLGINARYLNRIKKFADFEPKNAGQLSFFGVKASENTFLFNLSLGYIFHKK